MKRKLLSLTLALVLVLGMMPSARAARVDQGSEPVVLDICDGDITAVSSANTVTYTQGENVYTSTGGLYVIQSDAETEFFGRIVLSAQDENAMQIQLSISNLYLNQYSAVLTLNDNVKASLTLTGTNKFRVWNVTSGGKNAAVCVMPSAELTIKGTGSLYAEGYTGAGIGGYSGGSCGTIIINSGTITALGDGSSIGIGGRKAKITINGGTVTATGVGSSGIGGSDSTVVINGGTVTAEHGIGGATTDNTSVTINGGVVTANGGTGSPGISAKTILIAGGEVTATGGKWCAGIGAKSNQSSGTITITGGTVIATGGERGAGIGGGNNGGCNVISISGGTVTATGGSEAAGIGSGAYGAVGAITISGGTVVANGGTTGIGGGGKYGYDRVGDGGEITIHNAKVTASGSYHAIGSGLKDNKYGCDSIDIGKDAILALSITTEGGSLYQERIDIMTQPVSASANSGNAPLFAVQATGNSGLTYQWQVKNGEVWEDIPGQTAENASVPVTAETEGAEYRCAITNGWGNTVYTNVVKSSILAFTQQPESVHTELNDSAALKVVSSNPGITYQWQRSYDGVTWAEVAGKTTATLALVTTHSQNGAWYRCVITATNGDWLASDAAQITVNSSAVTYKTDYYLQNADGTYTVAERVTKESEAGVSVTAPEKQFDHYTEVLSKGTHSGTVAADGSLTLSRYYDRVSYTLNFQTNGGAALPAVTAVHGAAVTLPQNVSRRGYTFGGWYLDKDLTQEANITAMPTQDTTIYAKWTAIGEGRGEEYKINGITLLGSDYEPAQGIPTGGFWAQVSVTNLSSESMDTLILTAYDKDGRIQDMYFLCADPQVGQTFTLGVWIDNSDGSIAELRAIIIPVLGGSMIPLAHGVGVK